MRHGAFDGLDKLLSGRIPGVGLNASGRAQIRHLAERLSDRRVAALYTSPLQRAHDSAALLSQALSVAIHVETDLREVDFGAWTDQRPEDLAGDANWHAFNEHRATTRIPGGELMLEVQARAIACLLRLAGQHRDQTVVAVSHADVIRAVVAACLGGSLDTTLRLTVEPASVTELCLGDHPPRIIRVNDTSHLVVSASLADSRR